MKTTFALILALASAHTHAIMGGRLVPLAENPSTVGFESLGDVVPSPVVKCSGTKIAPNTYLTAAHCLDFTNRAWLSLPSDHIRRREVVLTISQGTAGPDVWPPPPGERRSVTTKLVRAFIHAGSNIHATGRALRRDVDAAIFVVDGDLEDAPPARLGTMPPIRRQRIAFTGYGRPDHLKCLLGDSFIESVGEVQFSLRKREAWQALIGINDSGGGVWSVDDQGRLQEMIGINSWQEARLSLNWRNRDISHHVRMDLIQGWIQSVLAGREAPHYSAP